MRIPDSFSSSSRKASSAAPCGSAALRTTTTHRNGRLLRAASRRRPSRMRRRVRLRAVESGVTFLGTMTEHENRSAGSAVSFSAWCGIAQKTERPWGPFCFLDREAGAAFGAAAGHHFAARLASHAREESVFPFPFYLLGAEPCDFHSVGSILRFLVQVNIYAYFSTCYTHPINEMTGFRRLRRLW